MITSMTRTVWLSYIGIYMGPKFYARVAMSHDKKCLCRMIRISKLCPSHVKLGVSPCRPLFYRRVDRVDFYPCIPLYI